MKGVSPLQATWGKYLKGWVNNRIKDKIRMTEYQAGKFTVDHINILNSIINHNKKIKIEKPIHSIP